MKTVLLTNEEMEFLLADMGRMLVLSADKFSPHQLYMTADIITKLRQAFLRSTK